MSLQAPVESDQQKKGRQPKPPKNEQVYEIQLSHEKKPSYFPLYWLFNRDPHNGLW